MTYRFLKTLFWVTLATVATPVFARHGTLLSTDRDSSINVDLSGLIASGWVKDPGKSVDQLTNLEVAQLTGQAAAGLPLPGMEELPTMSAPPMLPDAPQAPSASPLDLSTHPPDGLPMTTDALLPDSASPVSIASGKSVKELAKEYHDELVAMGVNTAKIEDRINQLEHNNQTLTELQRQYLARVGIQFAGYSRGYFNEYRGFGNNHFYDPAVYNAVLFTDMTIRSVPVPYFLFDMRIRIKRTIGFPYADPLAPTRGTIQTQWIELTNFNPYLETNLGDFLRRYTPLTLWNSEIPVYTLIEPTSFHRIRKDSEGLVSMNYGLDWRLRGAQLWTHPTFEKGSIVSSLQGQVMAGPVTPADFAHFGSFYAGSETAVRFFEDNLELKVSGLTLWDDPNTVSTTLLYTPKSYQIGSASGRLKIPFGDDIFIAGASELADSNYQDDLTSPTNAGTAFNDTAFSGEGEISLFGISLKAKYVNNGPYFYSPGAQTNRWTPALGAKGYYQDDYFGTDEGVIGMLDNFPFQGRGGVGSPYFAPYYRMSENVFPYGAATPNREGYIGSVTAEIGNHGFFKPQFSMMSQMKEIQPNYVINATHTKALPIDSTVNTTVARVFGGYEGALTIDFAKAFDLGEHTYRIQFDYKNQTTDLGLGVSPYTVNTMIGAVDFNIPFESFDTVILSASYEQAKSTGSEYVLAGQGNPDGLASYDFFLNNTNLGAYGYEALNITKTTWAFGFHYAINKNAQFHGDYFLNQYIWTDNPAYSRWENIWRFSYESTF
jgi:hypothetical protein